MNDSTKKIFKILISILVFGILLYILDTEALITAIQNISVSTIILGLFLYMITYLIRSFRFKVLIQKNDILLTEMLQITLIHGFYNRILPLRAGEVSYVYLMKRKFQLPTSIGIYSLVMARIFDIICTLFLFIFGLIIVLDYSMLKTILMLIILILLIILMVLMPILLEFIIKIMQNENLRKKIPKLNKMHQLEENLMITAKLSKQVVKPKIILLIMVTTLILWIIMYYIFYLIIKDVNINLNFLEVITASTLSNLSSILPVSSFGNFGTMEAGWTIGYMLFGIDKQIAVNSGFLVNTFTFICIFFYGLLAIGQQRLRK